MTDVMSRQDEWLFLPRPWMTVAAEDVTEDETIGRGTGAPRVCQRVYREGDDAVYVQGTVRDSDWATIVLPYWHQVVMNTAHRRATCER